MYIAPVTNCLPLTLLLLINGSNIIGSVAMLFF